ELGHDLCAHAAVAANDEVLVEVVQVPLQLALSPVPAKRVVCKRLGKNAKAIQHGSHAEDDEARGEDAPGGSLRMDLCVTDRADGDDHHVERVEQVPAIDQRVTGDAKDDDDAEEGQREPETAKWMLGVH